MTASQAPPLPVLPGYLLTDVLGQGAFAIVYKAHPIAEPGRYVAIKVARPGVDRQVLESEVEIARRVAHPGLVELYEAYLEHERPFIVQEYCPGGTLRRRLDLQGQLSHFEVIQIVDQVLTVLSWTHSEGVVHRDLKPENLLFDQDGNIRLVDFGLGRFSIDERSVLLSIGMVSRQDCPVGTFDYMAPEQKLGQGDHRVDLYALGVIIFEMLSGRRPDRNDSLSFSADLPSAWLDFWTDLYERLCTVEQRRMGDVAEVQRVLQKGKTRFGGHLFPDS